MSIIEKALGKLGSDQNDSKGQAPVERTPERVARDSHTRPGATRSREPDVVAERAGDHHAISRAGQTQPVDESASPPGTTVAAQPDAPDARRRIEIPFEELHAQGYLTPGVPRSTIAEEFRGVKRPLLKNIAGRSPVPLETPNLVMVTSALQGDGKTFSSINLAMSIAMEQDKTVLFVDADVLKGTAGRKLGVPDDCPGLIDLLMDNNVQPRDVILRTNVDKLRILPAGNSSEHATELLASESMHEFMLELAHRYPDRVIVFDSPPLLLTTEAGVLASFMGQIVFVAAADITPQYAVKEALQRIGSDKFVGVMLNRASRRRASLFGMGYGYGYGYAYGYGAGGADDKIGQARARAEQRTDAAEKPAA